MQQKLKIPEGLTENKVLEIINVVVHYLAPAFKFGYYDIDDMKQEGRCFCLEALPDFDMSRSIQTDPALALMTFFKVHVRRRFINLRRNKFERVEPPSCDCKLCTADSSERLDCPKYAAWVRRNMAKRSLVEPLDVTEVYSREGTNNIDTAENVMSREVIAALDKHMPAHARGDYRRLMEGVKLSKDRRIKVLEQIRNTLSEHYSGEAEGWNFE